MSATMNHLPPLKPLALVVLLVGAGAAHAHPKSPGELPLVPYSLTLKHLARPTSSPSSPASTCPDASLWPRAPIFPIPWSPAAARWSAAAGPRASWRSSPPRAASFWSSPSRAGRAGRHRRPRPAEGGLDAPQRRPRRGAAALKLPQRGSITLQGRQLVLTGNPSWVHRALRCVIRSQFGHRDLSPPAPSGR